MLELRRQYRKLGVEILRTSIKEYLMGDRQVGRLLNDDDWLEFWCDVAMISPHKVRERIKELKKMPSNMVGLKYKQRKQRVKSPENVEKT